MKPATYTSGIPVCPICNKGTERILRGSPAYTKEGEPTESYTCKACLTDYTVTGGQYVNTFDDSGSYDRVVKGGNE